MSVLLAVLARIALWVGAMCLVAGVAIVGPRRLYEFAHEIGPRLREARTPIAVLVGVVVLSAVGRGPLQTVSEIVGVRLTGTIYALEGEFVAWVQATFVAPELTIYFSWVYVYGYVFLLVFPFIAYGALSDTTTLRRLLLAYALNYGIGLVIYTLVLAYGPRNVMPDVVTSLLYTFDPDFQVLTAEVNEHTNVFPSLHTSLAVTAGLFAALTWEEYPAWTPIAVWLALSVTVSTMYLGIHWLVDVIGGIGLAVACVYLSHRLVEPTDECDVDADDAVPVAD
ncbi:hypothetical protein JCM18237_29230 [Halorubrum luteum]